MATITNLDYNDGSINNNPVPPTPVDPNFTYPSEMLNTSTITIINATPVLTTLLVDHFGDKTVALLDGTDIGQQKIINVCESQTENINNKIIIQPSNFGALTSMGLYSVSNSVMMVWDGSKWCIISGTGVILD